MTAPDRPGWRRALPQLADVDLVQAAVWLKFAGIERSRATAEGQVERVRGGRPHRRQGPITRTLDSAAASPSAHRPAATRLCASGGSSDRSGT